MCQDSGFIKLDLSNTLEMLRVLKLVLEKVSNFVILRILLFLQLQTLERPSLAKKEEQFATHKPLARIINTAFVVLVTQDGDIGQYQA